MRCMFSMLLLALAGGLGVAGAAGAEDAPYAGNLTGDWHGARTTLAERGVSLDLAYVGDFASNLTGGTQRTAAYAAAFDFVAGFDFERLIGWRGGSLHVELVNLNGTLLDTKAGLGSLLDTQEIWAPGHVTYATNFYLEQSLWDGRVDLKYGRMNFAVNFYPFACNFQNLGFCGTIPTWIDGNLVGWPTSAVGWSVGVHPVDRLTLKFARFANQPNNLVPSQGIKPWNRGGRDGSLAVGEIDLSTAIGGGGEPLAGTWTVGGWHNSARQPDLVLDINRAPQVLTGAAPLMHGSASGYYVTVQQAVSRNAAGRGVSLFLNFVQADRNVIAIDQAASVGLGYAVPFRTRAADSLNVALGRNHVSRRLAALDRALNATGSGLGPVRGSEYFAEVSYIAAMARGVALMPNLQYIRHPGGTSANDDAFVLGFQVSLTF